MIGVLAYLAGVLFGTYLQHRALVTLDATCTWCLASTAVMGALAGAAVIRAWRGA